MNEESWNECIFLIWLMHHSVNFQTQIKKGHNLEPPMTVKVKWCIDINMELLSNCFMTK